MNSVSRVNSLAGPEITHLLQALAYAEAGGAYSTSRGKERKELLVILSYSNHETISKLPVVGK